MSLINVINVVLRDSKTRFDAPISFDIFFEALQNLPKSTSLTLSYYVLIHLFCSHHVENHLHWVGRRSEQRY